ncbi:ERF family protein, partial [Pseudomonas aeruginosa]|uniref:ERF family protein n=3 Tax=Pseudomonas TaxID=286 RepID=UPI0015F02279
TTTTGTSIYTRLTHAGGACIEDEIPLPAQDKRDIKDYGAIVSYLRRYAKTALLDIAADDDLDANGDRDDDTQPGAQAEQQPEGNGKPSYPDEKLEKMLPQWRNLITSGKKTADQVIATVSSGNTLSPQQVEKIRGLVTVGASA